MVLHRKDKLLILLYVMFGDCEALEMNAFGQVQWHLITRTVIHHYATTIMTHMGP